MSKNHALKDETGKQYGQLTVLHRGKTTKGRVYWLCRCSCGREKEIWGTSLRYNRTKSCGCLVGKMTAIYNKGKTPPTFKDLLGRRFGKLTVLRRYNSPPEGVKWLCKCDCGNTKAVMGINLRKGKTRSCGCLVSETNSLPKGEAAFNSLYSSYRHSAKARGYIWELSKEEVLRITQRPCFYCGSLPSMQHRHPNWNGAYTHNGLDRVKNTEGYTSENVVSCCFICNTAKGVLSIEEFRLWAMKISKHFLGTGGISFATQGKL